MGTELDKFMKENVLTAPPSGETGNANQPAEQEKEKEEVVENKQDSKESAKEDLDLSKLPEEQVFSFLAGKVGKEIKSWEDLVVEKEVVKEVEKPVNYASPDLEVIDKFVRETGRGVEDYFRVQKNWDDEPNDKVLKEYLKVQYPTLDNEEIEAVFEESYSQLPTSDEMDDIEINDRKKKNLARSAAMKMEALKAKKFFNEQKSQYKTPIKKMEETITAGKEEWNKNMRSAVESIDKMELEGFTYEFRDKQTYNGMFSDMDSMMDYFKKDGVFDYAAFAKTIIAGRELPKILEEYGKAIKANTVEEELRRKSNATSPEVERRAGEMTDEEYRKYVKSKIPGLK
nr:MAG TPA: structural protein [Crassvirales sp.]